MSGILGMKRGSRFHLHQMKARIKLKGLDVVDRRTGAAKALVAWRVSLLDAIGGEMNATPQRRALVEQCVRAKLILDHVDSYLLEQESLINKRSRRVMPIVLERTRLSEHFVKLLTVLGLEKTPPPMKTLAEYLAESEEPAAAEQEPPTPPVSETSNE